MISIIIPCYNGARFLPRLFACLGRQTSYDFEVILVDDGSKDNSLEVARCEAAKYTFSSTIVSIENGGVSRARNIGLDHSRGEFLMFVDVDDLLSDDRVAYIQQLFIDTSVDVVLTGSHTVVDKDINPSSLIPIVQPKKETICYYTKDEILYAFLTETVHPGVWGGGIRRSVIEENHLRFFEGLKYSEDLHFIWQIFACSNKVCVSNHITYHYMWVPDSAMTRFGVDRLRGYEEIKSLSSFMEQKTPSFAEKFKKYAAARILWSIVRQGAVYLDYKSWRSFFSNINLRSEFFNLVLYRNLLVSISSVFYLFSPRLFYTLARLQARMKMNTRSIISIDNDVVG